MCFLYDQGQKSEQKPTTKNFVGFHNHSPLLTMTYTNSINEHIYIPEICKTLGNLNWRFCDSIKALIYICKPFYEEGYSILTETFSESVLVSN